MLGRLMIRDVPMLDAPSARATASPAATDAAHAFEDHADYVWNSLRRLGVPTSDLEDTTHDTFVAVFRSWEKYDPHRPIRPWLFVFALGVASDYRRRARHRYEVQEPAEPIDEGPSPVEQLLTQERLELARVALQAVSLSRRAVLILHELDDHTVPEIAAALDIPVATAYSRLRLARDEFAQAVRRLALRVK